MSDVVHGLYITALGMGLVFLTLGAIYLLMALLVRLLPPKSVPAAQPASAPVREVLEAEKVAAIGVALARALADESAKAQTTRQGAPDRGNGWAAAGRTRQLNHPQSREKKA